MAMSGVGVLIALFDVGRPSLKMGVPHFLVSGPDYREVVNMS